MCFSPEADLVTGLAVGVVAVDALRHVRRPVELPLAAIPAVLAAHLLVEAVVWSGLQGDVAEGLWRAAVWVYLLIAFSLLPVLVPVAVGALEPVVERGRMVVFVAIGAAVSLVLTYALLQGPVEARIEGHHIDYRVDLWQGGLIVVLYVVATCGALLVSSHRHVRWFGVGNLVAAAGLAWIDKTAFVSLWCAWAAVTSVAIALHLRHIEDTPPTDRLLTRSL